MTAGRWPIGLRKTNGSSRLPPHSPRAHGGQFGAAGAQDEAGRIQHLPGIVDQPRPTRADAGHSFRVFFTHARPLATPETGRITSFAEP